MAKLDLIIPFYKEDISVMEPMFSILKLQRNIKWTDFRVLIVCDGEDIYLPDGFGDDMPFEVKVINVPHGGVSAARNAGMDYSNAEWIMFCDSDDAFMTTTSLQTYFKFMTDDKVYVASAFFEEVRSPDDGRMLLMWHSGHDYIFVHSKIFRKKWLVDNNLRFNNALTLHEDSYFIAMTQYLVSKQNAVYIKDPLYLWQYNPKSVTRSHFNFVLQTYDELMKKNAALTDELLRRGMYVQAKGIVCRTITDAYCRLNCKSWNTPQNAMLIKDAEDCVALFLKRYDYIFKGAGEKVIQVGLDDFRNRLIKINDFDTESARPFDEWVDTLRE